MVVKINHRLGELNGQKVRNSTRILVVKSENKVAEPKSNDDSEPMQIGSIHGPLSK